MLKNRKLLAGGLAACIAVACLFSQDHIVSADGTSVYPTKTLAYTDLIVTANADLTVTYPITTNVTYHSEYSSAEFVSYLVDSETFVNEGDPIAEITSSIDEISLLQVQMELERTEDAYASYVTEAANALKTAQKAVSSATTDTQRRLASLALEKLKLQQESTKNGYVDQIDNLKEKVAAYQTESATTTITAPTSGLLHIPTQSYWRLHAGDMLYNGSYIGSIQSTDYAFFTLSSSGQLLNYGMEVTISDQDGNTYPAHIANSTSSTLTSTLITDYVVIVPDEEIPITAYNGLTATYETIHMEHVIMVPTVACHNDDNGAYVYVVTGNGALMKQYFTKGRTVKDQCVAYEGLTEGMTIVTN